jgi:hypothetical protein
MTFSLNPTYYQVTWTANGPTNYTGLTGTANGGLDPVTAWGINRLISVTGVSPVTGTPMADGETILINDYAVSFLSSDALADIINKINLAAKFTGVVADQSVAGTYITLMNAPGKEGYPFSLAEGNGTALLTKLGIQPGAYSYYPSEVGTAFTSVTTDSNITINGVNIVFTSGDVASAANQINAKSDYTGVAASIAGPYLQISAVSGQPWSINSGNAVSNLGTTLGNHGGYPTTIEFSQAKERANMRWSQMVSELEENATPILLGNITRTGNISNVETTSVTFTVGYDRPDTVYTVARSGEPDVGNLLVGAGAVKRAVARALTSVITGNRKLFDPTLQSYGAYCDRPNAARIQQITATGLDTVENVTIVEDNLTVIQIAGV